MKEYRPTILDYIAAALSLALVVSMWAGSHASPATLELIATLAGPR